MNSVDVGVLCTILGTLFGYIAFYRKSKADARTDAQESTTLAVKLDYISKGVDDIRLDIKSTNREVEELKEAYARHDERIVRCTKRLDKLEQGGDN